MFGLTTLGFYHTVFALIAVVAGFVALARSGSISSRTVPGQLFIWLTVVTCLTGFGIFQHGGFGKPHVLGIVTLVILAAAYAAERWQVAGRFSRLLAPLSYSFALFLHAIPGLNETLTRLPRDQPYLSSPEDPKLQTLVGAVFLVFLVGAFVQWRKLRR